ncbi:MAG: hypothetical protein O2867_01930 [Bacteroidetes bacterium]|jgi:hypothetical protein|nr:hypothetical protein [Bacteroidota bacterium]
MDNPNSDLRIATCYESKRVLLSCGSGEKKLFVTITNLCGQIIRHSLMQFPYEMDISDFYPGSYFVETIESRMIKRVGFEIKR